MCHHVQAARVLDTLADLIAADQLPAAVVQRLDQTLLLDPPVLPAERRPGAPAPFASPQQSVAAILRETAAEVRAIQPAHG